MSEQVVAPRIRGFISLTAHPEGCAANVRGQIEVARAAAEGAPPLGPALVIGSSTGYGLASLLSACFGYGAPSVGVCLERPSEDDKPASAGWYNLAEAHRIAAAEGGTLRTVNTDAFSNEAKEQVAAELRAMRGQVELLVYSLAAPLRRDADTDEVWRSTLKPIGKDWTGKTIDLRRDRVTEATIEAASEEEIAATVKVMGGEDWAEWVRWLGAEGLLADNCRSVAYSYVGPEATLRHLPCRHDRAGQGTPRGDRARPARAARAGRGRRLGEHQQGHRHAGLGGHPRRRALHERALRRHEGAGHARRPDRADRTHAARPPRPRRHAGHRRRAPHPPRRPGDDARGPVRGRAAHGGHRQRRRSAS